jgi:diaminohydroxyphosphoribosylaminopyrimidine deaminase / 5-amino-6-(5-phosphoribosylamino)uracil reductase
MHQHSTDEIFMARCIQLARLGVGTADPNPLVGSVIVCNGKIIGEGYHRQFGQAHAEVNAIASVRNQELLKNSTIYVNLEPCSHFGKTPPCADLIISKQIPRVVIGMVDPFTKVNGTGVKKLKDAGCEVETGVLENECRELNRAFITFFEKKRPYIILKWAQSVDGLIDSERTPTKPHPTWITNETCRSLVHKWRTEVKAIMVGYNTALADNPRLNIRDWSGPAPLRIVTDRNLQLPLNLALLDRSQPTWVLNTIKEESTENIDYIRIPFDGQMIPSLMQLLYNKGINQLLIEGGQLLLQSFIDSGLWDEARVFKGNVHLHNGVKAPVIRGNVKEIQNIGGVKLELFRKE